MKERDYATTPFLEQVARHYYNTNKDLIDYCFVFPNRRSGEFLLMHLAQMQPGIPMIAPRITTITDFAANLTHSIAASTVEQLFTLYEAYVEVTGNELYEFDRFAYWGNVVLNDFNDVDTSLVDATQLFTNTRELREISTDYFTPELKETLERYFNVQFGKTSDEDGFWKHVKGNEDVEVRREFLRLWQIMLPLYTKFREKLTERGLSYSGKIMRDAVEKIKTMGPDDFREKKYVFVGFNLLSACELSIFDLMQKKGIAEFCWDYFSPAFKEKSNLATRYLDFYVKRFKSPIDLPDHYIDSFPQMTVVSVPNNMGQAKCAFKIVNELVKQKEINNVDNAIDTAIVLPDEHLFPPLLNSATDAVSHVNVTMGYPLRNSSIASLMRIVSKMHRQAARQIDSNDIISYTYYREDVKSLLSHPIIKSLFARESIELTKTIDNNNLYQVPEQLFSNVAFSDLFVSIHNINDALEVTAYLDRLLHFIERIDKMLNDTPDETTIKEQDRAIPLQNAFFRKYYEVLEQVKQSVATHGVPMCESTVFYLIDRLVGLHTIPFQGEPLAGLQLMGVLETRCLDFNNVILLSMNERVFPRKFFKPSFIPYQLRRHFVMPTMEHQESMMAYYFYRLIGRARNVYMLYDCSTKAFGSGEPSRFITQLEKIYNCHVTHVEMRQAVAPGESLKINVKKEGRARERLEQFVKPVGGMNLSASSIKEYIACPLKFYFHYVQDLNADNEQSDFMDAATFGSIVHDTLQQLYFPGKEYSPKNPYKVFKGRIEQFKRNELEQCLVRNINRIYLHRKPDKLDTPITGEPSILFEAFKLFVLNVIDYDLKLLDNENCYFEVWECEVSHVVTLDLGNGVRFNFKFKADRIDRINGTGPLRIIDYKTGKDETTFSSFESIFAESGNYKRAILQLFLYCNAYEKVLEEQGFEKMTLTPIIYKLKRMSESGINYKPRNKDAVTIDDYNGTYHGLAINDEFKSVMGHHMKEFFDFDTPFSQCSENSTTCNYCNFIEFCRRNKKEIFGNSKK